MSKREELFTRFDNCLARFRSLQSVVQNPGVITKEQLEEFRKISKEGIKDLQETINEFDSLAQSITTDVTTEIGRICILIKELNESKIQEAYYNNNILEARQMEYDCNVIVDMIINNTIDEKILKDFCNKYKEVYDVDIKEIKVEKPVHRSCLITGLTYKRLYGLDLNDDRYKELLSITKKLIINAINNHILEFNVGINLGYPLLILELLEGLKKDYPQIKVNAVVPFRSIKNHWDNITRAKYEKLISYADNVTYIGDMFSDSESVEALLLKRNDFLVENSDFAILCCSELLDDYSSDILAKSVRSCKTTYNIDSTKFKFKKWRKKQ